jgi:hypothetical protein
VIRREELAISPNPEDTFLREVDDELRRDELSSLWKKWGRTAIAAIVCGLALFAGYLWWNTRSDSAAGVQGEAYDQALQSATDGKSEDAKAKLTALGKSENAGYRTSALLTQAALALEKQEMKEASRIYGLVAGDKTASQPWRDLALVRQTVVEFDTIKPEVVISRLTPLVVKGNPWFGSAGELVAIANIKLGKNAEAGKIFGAMYKDETVPESIRSRAVKMAGVLGVDVVNATNEVNTQ